ncbi:MAG TPA: tRNA 2-thiouridine(34) synthase MnmA [Candidatus Paceibacterota bacterium]|nr:tRNA 2-thiouridine(34) synthase MnmA [Candidatus Paceibacterota bacterium]
MTKKAKVFVGLSGGVDSSVAALRLKNAGFEVVGVFIKVWHPEFLVCNWESERLDAMRVAAHLDIPFLTCDAEAAYRDYVAKYFISEYLAGRTPNPDVMCNKEVKFGEFMKFAKEYQADFIATGHYARRIDNESPELHRGVDSSKDQSYFLWSLTPEQLSFSLFPVGNSEKLAIREEAKQAGIPIADKKDSQGVCFLGHIDIKDFLSHYVDINEGVVLNEAGEVIGTHQGALIYTIGQRHGFNINEVSDKRTAYFVTAKNLADNTITASPTKPVLVKQGELKLTNTVLRKRPEVGEEFLIQTRYRQNPVLAKILFTTEAETVLQLLEESEAVALGQSCVLYQGSHCIGGGIIS